MAQPAELVPVEPQSLHLAENDQKLALLREALLQGIASPDVDGDIFDIVREKYGLPRDDS